MYIHENKDWHGEWVWIPLNHVEAPVFTNFPMTLECRIQRKIDVSEEGWWSQPYYTPQSARF